jgi:hypothetical protein
MLREWCSATIAGDPHRARDDRGVRRGAAQVGHERRERVLAEEDHVRGREVARHQDRGLLAHRLHRDAPAAAGERAQHALGHLAHVVLALAQVRILDVAELRHQLVQLHAQRPLGVAVLLADDVARRLGEGGVVEQHQCTFTKGASSADALWRTLSASSFSSSRTSFTARS